MINIKTILLLIIIYMPHSITPPQSQASLQGNYAECKSPLMRAIRQRDLAGTAGIIKSGETPNVRDCSEESTPLIESIALNLPSVAKSLILSGADPNYAAGDGTTPLIVASWYCQHELVSQLLDRGATVNSASEQGTSALMAASQTCMDGKIVRALLKAGAKPDSRDKSGANALTIASFFGNEAAVRALLAAGADPNAQGYMGETALALCRGRDVGRLPAHDRIGKLLVEAIRRR